MSYAGAAHDGPVPTEAVRPADDWMKLNGDAKSALQPKKSKKKKQQQPRQPVDEPSMENGQQETEKPNTVVSTTGEGQTEERVPRPQLNPADLPLEKHRIEQENHKGHGKDHPHAAHLQTEDQSRVQHLFEPSTTKSKASPKVHHPKASKPEHEPVKEDSHPASKPDTQATPTTKDRASTDGTKKAEKAAEAPQTNGAPAAAAKAPEPIEANDPPNPSSSSSSSYAHQNPELAVSEQTMNGHHLVSIPKKADHEQTVQLQQEENPSRAQAEIDTRQRAGSELTRGRKPGQGWDESKIRVSHDTSLPFIYPLSLMIHC